MILLCMLLLFEQSHTLLQPSSILKHRQLNKSSYQELDSLLNKQRIIYDKEKDLFVRTVVFPSRSNFEESFEAFIKSGTFASPYQTFQNGSRNFREPTQNYSPFVSQSPPAASTESSNFIVMPTSIFQPITESFIAEMNSFFSNMGQNMGNAMAASMPANFAYATPVYFNQNTGSQGETTTQNYYPSPSSPKSNVEHPSSSQSSSQKYQNSNAKKPSKSNSVPPPPSNINSGSQGNYQSIKAKNSSSSSGGVTIGSASASTSRGSSSASISRGKNSYGESVLLGSTTANESKLIAILPTNVTIEPTGLIVSSRSNNEASKYVKDPNFIDTLGKSIAQDPNWEEEQVKKSFHGLTDHIDLENAEVFVEGKDAVVIQILKPVRGQNLEDLIKYSTSS